MSCFVLVKLHMKYFLSLSNKPSRVEIISLPFNPSTCFIPVLKAFFFFFFANKLTCPLAAIFAFVWPKKKLFPGIFMFLKEHLLHRITGLELTVVEDYFSSRNTVLSSVYLLMDLNSRIVTP